MAIVMAGIPAALSLGVPAGTNHRGAHGWRTTFWVMTALAVVLLGWIAALVPDRPGLPRGERPAILRTLAVPGVAAILLVTFVFVLAHTVLYTYIATFLDHLGLAAAVDLVLLVFGVASLASIWITGAHIDRRLRALTIAGTLLVGAAATLLALPTGNLALVCIAAALWGLGWGGIPTLLQTAAGHAGGSAADSAQAMLVTLWNAAMAGGGVAGGLLLDLHGPTAFPWTVLVLLLPVLATVVLARTHAFPAAVDHQARWP
jgi:predicted MFS family arabinose efflux permease